VLLSGSECERERLDGLDKERLEVDGLELYQGIIPMVVAIDDFNMDVEQIAVVGDCVDHINGLAPGLLQHQETGEPGHIGWALVSVGVPPPTVVGDPDPGGVALLEWDASGGILYCDIVIHYEYAYDLQTFRDTLLHEMGHCPLGLAHDGDSIDLGSCMSSPVLWDCDYTDNDVQLFGEVR